MSASARKAPPTGRVARTVIAAGTAARVGASQLRHRLRPAAPAADEESARQAAHEAEIGRLVFTALNQLRGTALKAAQVLSMGQGLLPEGVRVQLAQAQHRALPLNRALVSRVFRQAFGREPQDLFAEFEHQAFAAASLGQVHRARLWSERLAVKVQYPGIGATIDSDLGLLRSSLRAIGGQRLGLPRDELVDKVLAEIRRQLAEEVDYRHEAAQQAWFAQQALQPDILIPEPVPELSGATVLTQQFLEGEPLDAWCAAGPAQPLRNRQAQAVWDWFTRSAFGLGRIHGDLHPGNFLFRADGRVGVLDFGCTAALDVVFRRTLARSWLAWLDQGPAAADELLACYHDMGAASTDLAPEVFRTRVLPGLAPVLDWATEPFRAGVFDFSVKSALPLRPDASQRAAASRLMSDVPLAMLSFDRAWFALMHLLTRLQGRVDTREAHRLLQTAAD
jgi:predicted unusual protein kinase regulating ubiquinone biosynthesis (AarF/ABC1/UbiB family)